MRLPTILGLPPPKLALRREQPMHPKTVGDPLAASR